jgi:hypothetical protein
MSDGKGDEGEAKRRSDEVNIKKGENIRKAGEYVLIQLNLQ